MDVEIFSMNDVRENKSLILLMCMSVVYILCITFLRYEISWENMSRFDLASNAWIALSNDFNNGLFYRPLYEPTIGFGGTRFFPLYFLLLSWTQRLFGDFLLAGKALTGFLILFQMSVFGWYLKKINIKKELLLFFVVCGVAGLCLQWSFSVTRGDLLPATFTIVGLIFSLDFKKFSAILAAIMFSLAFSAKMTSVQGVIAVSIVYLLRDKELLFWFLGSFLFCLALILLGLYVYSDGRIFRILSVCGGGGMDRWTILSAPKNFFFALIRHDQVALIFLSLALLKLGFFIFNGVDIINIPALFFVSSLVFSLFLFTSPGITYNHFIELHLSSVSFIAHGFFSFHNKKKIRKKHFLSLAVLLLISSYFLTFYYLEDTKKNKSGALRDVSFFLKNNTAENDKILSTDPLPLVLARRSVFMIDPFMFVEIRGEIPEAGVALAKFVAEGRFRYVILHVEPDKKLRRWKYWYQRHLGEDILEEILLHYVQVQRFGPYRIYQINK